MATAAMMKMTRATRSHDDLFSPHRTSKLADVCYPFFSARVARYSRFTTKKDLKLPFFLTSKRAFDASL